MIHEYFLHDWITKMDDKRELWFSSSKKKTTKEKFIEEKFDQVVETILEMTKLFIKERNQQYLPVSFFITCQQQEDDEDHVICTFRIPSVHQDSDHKPPYRCLSHVHKESLSHIFTSGIVWVATELNQSIKLTLDPSL